MPVLKNARHELFCQEIAKGSTATDAHERAGFARNDGNASMMFNRPDVQERLKELKGHVAQRVIEETAIDRARILQELGLIALSPLGSEVVRAADKRAALVDYARIEGWVIERTETGKPGDFDRMADDELEAFISRREGAVGESGGRTGSASGQTGVRGKPSGIH